MVSSLQSDLGADRIRLAFMEFCGPTLMDVAAEAVSKGTARLRLLPLFLAGGAHVANDIPRIVHDVREAHPALEVEVLAPVGEDPRFVALLKEIATEHAAGQSPG